MFDIFGIRRRRAEREAAAAAAKQKMLDEREAKKASRKEFIDAWLQAKHDEASQFATKCIEKSIKDAEEANSTCPVCGSKNRIHKFVRTKGQLDGHLGGSSSGYSSFFGGYSHGSISGKIHGELDTFEVNECKDCGNQWEITQPKTLHSDWYRNTWDLSDNYGRVGFLYRRIYHCLEDPEEYGKIGPYSPVKNFKGTPRMVLEYLLYSFHVSWCGYGTRDDVYADSLFGIPLHKDENKENFNDDSYLFEFTDEMWDYINKIIS